eukprot:6214810-Pleurochrysis_carterae.AAC.2
MPCSRGRRGESVRRLGRGGGARTQLRTSGRIGAIARGGEGGDETSGCGAGARAGPGQGRGWAGCSIYASSLFQRERACACEYTQLPTRACVRACVSFLVRPRGLASRPNSARPCIQCARACFLPNVKDAQTEN